MYRSLATFHDQLLIHKIAELERLLNALGAREYSIEHVERTSRGAAGTVQAVGVGAAGAGFASGELTERKWSGSSDGHPPSLPDRLVWYDGEPEWKNLVESRLNGSRRRFAFSVSQSQDFGVDAKVVAAVEALGLGIGGSFRSARQVEFAVSGTF